MAYYENPYTRNYDTDLTELVEIAGELNEKIEKATAEGGVAVTARDSEKLGGKLAATYINQDNIAEQSVWKAENAGNAEKLGNIPAREYITKATIGEQHVAHAENADNADKLGGYPASDFFKQVDLENVTARDSEKLGGELPEIYFRKNQLTEDYTAKNALNLADIPAEQYRLKTEIPDPEKFVTTTDSNLGKITKISIASEYPTEPEKNVLYILLWPEE